MNIPQFLKEVKSGDFLTTKHGNILCVQRVDIDPKEGVRVYPFFDYDPDDKIFEMNEWLRGFYGPRFDEEDFYRPSTKEEKTILAIMMARYGYELRESYGEMIPMPTFDGYLRMRQCVE